MEPSTELANLEKDNARRLDALTKLGVTLQPGTFELIQITTYLEYLLNSFGPDCVLDAKMKFAEKAAAVITQLETASRKAQIVNGRFTPPKGNGA